MIKYENKFFFFIIMVSILWEQPFFMSKLEQLINHKNKNFETCCDA